MNEFSVLHPNSDRTPRVIPCDCIDAETNQLDDIQPSLHRTDDFFRRVISGLEIKVRRTDGDGPGCRATPITRRLRAEFPGRIRGVQVVAQNAVFYNWSHLRRHTFIIEWTRAEACRHKRVIDYGNILCRNLLPDLIDQE